MSAITDILNNPAPLMDDHEPLRTRLRASRACDVCASLKCKCDGATDRPCQRCARLHLSCTYTRVVKKRGGSRIKSRNNSGSTEDLAPGVAYAQSLYPPDKLGGRRHSDAAMMGAPNQINTTSPTFESSHIRRASAADTRSPYAYPQGYPYGSPAAAARLPSFAASYSMERRPSLPLLPYPHSPSNTGAPLPSMPLTPPSSASRRYAYPIQTAYSPASYQSSMPYTPPHSAEGHPWTYSQDHAPAYQFMQ